MSAARSSTRLVASIFAVPAVFVAAFVAAFLVMGAADALAQPAEDPTPTETADMPSQPDPGGDTADMPPHGFAPPSDEPPPHGDETGDAHGSMDPDADPHAADPHAADPHAAAAHGGGHEDPTKHFNFFGFSYRGKDIAGGNLGDGQNIDPNTGEVVGHGEEAMSAPFVLMVLNFLILVALLAWKGGPIVRKLAAERHDQIKDALDEAAQLRQLAADKLAEYETKLKDADAEIARMVDGMKKDAEADKARILDNAEKQAAQMKRDAEARIAAEIEYARANLTREVTAAASLATEKLLRDKMVPGDQQKLVTSFITDVQAQPTAAKERV